jgi:phosphate transport system substrate-binding protein
MGVFWARLLSCLALCCLSYNVVAARADTAGTPTVLGAGSTFDAPFFATAFPTYSRSTPLVVNYQAVGSGSGIQKFIDGDVDFAASDVPMNQLELTLAQRTVGPVVQIPAVLGGVAVAYNEPKLLGNARLQLDGPTLVAIFLGKITLWDDPVIARLNPGLRLPADQIHPVHRSDSSGTTYIFTDYLSAVSPTWAAGVGKGKSVAWPAGFHGMGSPGVSQWIASHEGSIGYVELKYAIENHLSYALIRNRSGAFVAPTVAGVSAAATQFPTVNASNFSIVNAPGQAAYPIAGYSWILLRGHPRTAESGSALVKLFRWFTTSGQRLAGPLNYAPLPVAVQAEAAAGLAAVTVPTAGT